MAAWAVGRVLDRADVQVLLVVDAGAERASLYLSLQEAAGLARSLIETAEALMREGAASAIDVEREVS